MEKTKMVPAMLGGLLTLCTLTGCGPENSTDTSSFTDSISATETASEEEVMVKQENIDFTNEEIVEEVIEQVVVDEDADGEENGISQEIVIP